MWNLSYEFEDLHVSRLALKSSPQFTIIDTACNPNRLNLKIAETGHLDLEDLWQIVFTNYRESL
jgi:hypothetical protein